ncbi:MAG: dockerin type I repeat-containing protein [Acutalibacteraceae bacterium]|nr:dockerin type I repeat-containing protein [Acutalibacteraceae bacterium]
MKKTISLLLSICIMLCCMLSVSADEISYKGKKVALKAAKGDTVEISVSVGGVKKASGVHLVFTFDNSCLKYNSYTSSEGKALVINDADYELSWSTLFNAKGTDFDTKKEIITFNFTALSDISLDDKKMTYYIKEFFDVNMTDLPQTAVSVVSKTNGETVKGKLWGDANGDDKISTSDALVILRHSINITQIDENRINICDVNNDGKITANDSMQITRYSIGYKSNYPIGEVY